MPKYAILIALLLWVMACDLETSVTPTTPDLDSTPRPTPTSIPTPTPTVTLAPPRQFWLDKMGCEDCPILKLEPHLLDEQNNLIDLKTLRVGQRFRATACSSLAVRKGRVNFYWAYDDESEIVPYRGVPKTREIVINPQYAKSLPSNKKFGGCVAMTVTYKGLVEYDYRRGDTEALHPTFNVSIFTRIDRSQHERGYFPESE